MMSQMFFSDDDKRNIICASCQKYLSVPPIVIQENTLICGRCNLSVKKDEKNLYNTCAKCYGYLGFSRQSVTRSTSNDNKKAYFYETVAKFMFFPCVNDMYGCSVQSSWENTLTHGNNCTFEHIICPANECNSEISKGDIIKHFEHDHEDQIMNNNELSFTSINDDCNLINKLCIWKDCPIIVTVDAHENKDMLVRLSSLYERILRMLRVTLIIKNKSSTLACFNEIKVMYFVKSQPFLMTENITNRALRRVPLTDITLEFIFEEILETPNNDKILTQLECLICCNCMEPPIYICSKGHSLCNTCRMKLEKCPYCFTNLSDSIRNVALEEISKIVSHTASSSTPLSASLNCLAEQIGPCQWKESYDAMFKHLSSSHKEHCLDLKRPIYIQLEDHIKRIRFFHYDRAIFKLYIDSSVSNTIGWAVECIRNPDEDEEKYVYYLGMKNDERIFKISEVCGNISTTSHNQDCPKYVNIPLLLLKPFAKHNKLYFTLNIVKSH